MDKKQNRRKLLKKLKNRYRLLIINETNLQEKTSISLTPSNVILIGSAGLLLFSLISWGIYTLFPGVKDYATGYSQTFDGKMKNEVLKKLSRLENELYTATQRELAMRQIINGEEVTAVDAPYTEDKNHKPGPYLAQNPSGGTDGSKNNIPHYAEEGEAAEPVAGSYLFFSPIKGKVNANFDIRVHPGIDIVTGSDEFVRATMDGTVVFSGWTPEFGYIITLQHVNNWMSVYKFNSAVYKEPGTYVQAGETIAITGYTDKENSVKQLRFELWHNGIAVNPLNYIVF